MHVHCLESAPVLEQGDGVRCCPRSFFTFALRASVVSNVWCFFSSWILWLAFDYRCILIPVSRQRLWALWTRSSTISLRSLRKRLPVLHGITRSQQSPLGRFRPQCVWFCQESWLSMPFRKAPRPWLSSLALRFWRLPLFIPYRQTDHFMVFRQHHHSFGWYFSSWHVGSFGGWISIIPGFRVFTMSVTIIELIHQIEYEYWSLGSNFGHPTVHVGLQRSLEYPATFFAACNTFTRGLYYWATSVLGNEHQVYHSCVGRDILLAILTTRYLFYLEKFGNVNVLILALLIFELPYRLIRCRHRRM